MPPKKGTAKAKGKEKAAASKKRTAVQADEVELPEPPKKKTRTESPTDLQPSAIPQHQNTEIPASASTAEKLLTATPIANDTTMPANGGFCLYSMDIPHLQKVLVPDAKTKTKDYAALFVKIKEFQAKKGRTAQIHVVFPPETGYNGYGRFKSRSQGFIEPMGDMPYDIGIASLTRVENAGFACPAGFAGDIKDKRGVSGATILAEEDCGITTAQGEFKMRTIPVWKIDGPGGGEIYEGYVTFAVKYGMYSRKGFGSGTNEKYAFWAVRSREEDILDKGELEHLANEAPAGSAIYMGFDEDDLLGGFGDDLDGGIDYDSEFEDSDEEDYGYGYHRRGRYDHGYGHGY